MVRVPSRQLALAESCRRQSDLSDEDLYFRCLALGGAITLGQLDTFLHGALRPTPHEFNVIAVALNEYLAETGEDQVVPYVEVPRFPRRNTYCGAPG